MPKQKAETETIRMKIFVEYVALIYYYQKTDNQFSNDNLFLLLSSF